MARRKATRQACAADNCGEVHGVKQMYKCKICKCLFCGTCITEFNTCMSCTDDAVADAIKATLNPEQIGDSRAKIARAQKLVADMAKNRDELRNLYQEMYGGLEDIILTVGEGASSIEAGLRQMDDGLDKCSELI